MSRPLRTHQSRLYRGYVLAILVVVYTFNFIDRQIVGILAVPIKTDLGLTDTELGLMGGLAFALFYTGLGIPIAVLADRRSRTWIMTIALTFWSAMTAICGLAQNFWSLFLARLGVGVGEAGGVAPAYSLIADYFPPDQRARALSIFAFGIPIGSALGIFFGGYVATHVDWRFAFFAVGIAGVAFAPLFKLTVHEPERAQFDAGGRTDSPALTEIVQTLVEKPSFWLVSVGTACASMIGYGMLFWLPSFFVRSFDMALIEAARFYGSIILIGGLAGLWLGGWAGDRLGAERRAAYVVVPALAFAGAVPMYLLALSTQSLVTMFLVMLVPTALGFAWLGPVLSTVQHVVPANMRATASAVFLFINNLIGIGIGTVAIGAISDAIQVRFGDDALRYAVMTGTGFYVIAAALLLLGARFIDRDWET